MRAGLAPLLLALAATACATMNTARPLEPGEHAVGVTLGGPLLRVPNIGAIPTPQLTLEGRHGLIDGLDMSYGFHALPAAYGVAGLHVGGTWLVGAEDGPIPALALGQRLYGFTNRWDPRIAADRRAGWGLWQTDVTASWAFGDHLAYGGVGGYMPLPSPRLLLAPFLGVELRPFVPWARLQVEGRWLAPNIDTTFGAVSWIGPGNRGALILNLGVAFVLGGGEAS
jgi:hypothetical protein